MEEYDDGPYWVVLLMYGFHDMRHIGFRRLTVVNGTLGFWGVTFMICNVEFDSNYSCLDRLNNFGINCLQKL